MNNRNINAAAKPETIRTAMKKLRDASDKCARICRNKHRDETFRNHIGMFANPNVCYIAVNGISVPVPLC